ncbi:MAG TPA: DUF3570 domain-containing protein [Opitutaceae bacterium]|nr:DUF3570 domain-containing protein [Opitutaceae bacterium]
MNSKTTCWLLILLLELAHPRLARTEDAVSYKYQDYRESGDRIAVQVHGAMIEKDLGTATKLKVHGVIDTIAGATPTGEPPRTPGADVPLSMMEEERKAWGADLSRQFGDLTLSAGIANSRESDYVSNGWSLNALRDFNSRNTTLALGIAGTSDDVKVFYQLEPADKRSLDVIAGITQLLDPRTSVSLNVTRSHASGYLSDPYKLVEQIGEVFPGIFLRQTFPENRPDSRTKWIVLGSINRSLPALHAAIDASYRFHDDDFGITSHTLNLEWYQKLGERVTLRPHFRVMQQSAADFYRVTFTGASFTPSNDPTGTAPFYSADYRLSDLRTTNYGLKLVWELRPNLQFDAALEKYDMKGRDGMTSASAYPQATIFTVGGRFAF